VDADKLKDLAEAKALLEAQAPKGAAPDPFQAKIVVEATQTEARIARQRSGTARKAAARGGG
jgi:hypothetical protein